MWCTKEFITIFRSYFRTIRYIADTITFMICSAVSRCKNPSKVIILLRDDELYIISLEPDIQRSAGEILLLVHPTIILRFF